MTSDKPTVIVAGANGQLGRQLARDFADDFKLIALSRSELDISSIDSCKKAFNNFKPQIIVNAAAYTNVDKAEDEPNKAALINETGPKNLAECAFNTGSKLVHISTDYVFNSSLKKPLKPKDETCPCNVYGKTKLAGEKAIRKILGPNALIIRTAWLYSAECSNFMLTMLRLMKEKPSISVVSDQYGTPTSVISLSRAIKALINANAGGIFHFTDGGAATRHSFALKIQELALEEHILERKIPIVPVSSAEYKTKAVRPLYSVLDSSAAAKTANLTLTPWQDMLKQTLKVYKSRFASPTTT